MQIEIEKSFLGHPVFVTFFLQEGLPGVFNSVAFQREWIAAKIQQKVYYKSYYYFLDRIGK